MRQDIPAGLRQIVPNADRGRAPHILARVTDKWKELAFLPPLPEGGGFQISKNDLILNLSRAEGEYESATVTLARSHLVDCR